jgi:hypothetical protein
MYQFKKFATFRLEYNVPISLGLVENNHNCFTGTSSACTSFMNFATFRLGCNVPISLELVEKNHSLFLLILAAHVPVSKLSLLFV